MDPEILKQIENSVNAIQAQQNAQQVLILGLIGQMAGEAKDWRERLEVMRGVAENAVARYEFVGADPADQGMRQAMLSHVRGAYDSIQAGLLEYEKNKPRPL